MRYDYTRLKEFADEHNIILLDDYSEKPVNIFFIIEGQCLNKDCNDIFSKSFRSLFKTNGYCLNCSTKSGILNKKNTMIKNFGFDHYLKSPILREKNEIK